MSKYDILDEHIVAAIRKKPCTYASLLATENVGGLADALIPPGSLGDGQGWRLIDRRLQALRKVGVIEHRDGYWRISRNF